MGSGWGRFRVDRAGVSSVFRSAALQGALMSVARPVAASASAAARASDLRGPFGDDDRSPYAARTKVLTHTAVAVVDVNSTRGAVAQARDHVLDSANH